MVWIHIIFRYFFIIVYHRILHRLPCATQQVLIVYLFHIQQCVFVHLELLIYPFHGSISFLQPERVDGLSDH